MDEIASRTRLIWWVMAAVAVWGAVLAIGAWRLNHDVRRTFVVAACVAGFLGFWGTMLAFRARRMRGR
jgi:CHASE2 domain-containing sensor protein